MLVVFDSNVIISAFITRTGICRHVYELCLLNHKIVISEEILKEVKVKLRDKLKYKKAEVNNLISLLKFHGSIVKLENDDTIACRDEKDKHVLELAIKSKADLIISGDKDLRELSSIGKTRILNAREFWLKFKD